jgi:hypothetical protein
VVNETKFLSIIFDSKFNFQTPHCKPEKEVSESHEPVTCGHTLEMGSRQHVSGEILPLCGEIEIGLRLYYLWIGKGFLPGKPSPGSCRTKFLFGSFPNYTSI